MNAIAFQSVIKNNKIDIPMEYGAFKNEPALVMIVNMPMADSSTEKANDSFAPANIDTTGWKFDREQANER